MKLMIPVTKTDVQIFSDAVLDDLEWFYLAELRIMTEPAEVCTMKYFKFVNILHDLYVTYSITVAQLLKCKDAQNYIVSSVEYFEKQFTNHPDISGRYLRGLQKLFE